MKRLAIRVLSVCFLAAIPGLAEERPNILWITSEDNASHWLACYGNKQASTPVLDSLAANGLKFTHAYANSPVCALARSTILNGAYAVTQGTQYMRSRYSIPADFKGHATYLREAGYYCTNNAKTDYNFNGNDASIWDDCSGRAHYKNRPEGKPFFAIFNLTITHESNLFPEVVRKNRKAGLIPNPPRLATDPIQLPPQQPDLPEFREDTAIYHDCVTAMDKQVGWILDELRETGLAEDTIIFYYSDHGGATVRGKRYLEDSGARSLGDREPCRDAKPTRTARKHAKPTKEQDEGNQRFGSHPGGIMAEHPEDNGHPCTSIETFSSATSHNPYLMQTHGLQEAQ